MTLGDYIGWFSLITVVLFVYALIFLIVAKARSIKPKRERNWIACVIYHKKKVWPRQKKPGIRLNKADAEGALIGRKGHT